MTNSISLSDFEAEVNSAREGFDGWAAARKNALTVVQEQHGDLIQEVHERAKALNLEESHYLQAAVELKDLLSKQKAELDALTADMAKLQAEEQKWPAKLAQLRGDTEAMVQSNEQERAELEDASAVKTQKAQALTEFRDKYERSLGLRFEHSAMVECHPPTPGIEDLVTHVNKTNDFSAFVRAMRVKFVEQCRTQQNQCS